MSAGSRSRAFCKPTLRTLSREMSGLRARVEELEDLRDLKAGVTRNGGKAGVSWAKAKANLGLT